MKNRKSIIALLLVAIVGIVGLTFAFFSNSSTVENEFNTLEYGTTYTEEFVSPDNWLPGDTTNKTIIATNTGETDEAVRIHVSEAWTTNNNGTLNGWIHTDGTKSTHTTSEELANDERVAILNLANTSDWTKVGDYYYYNYKLAPTESTTSFLESVTFNSKTKLDDTCTTSTSNGVTTTTCNSSGDDYDNATYTLTLTVETVQYNKYASAWGTGNSVAIATEKPLKVYGLNVNSTSKTYETGDKGEMFAFEHEATEQTDALTDYRYIGDQPNNYVKFNCDNDGTNCEIWRILGVFGVDDGNGNVEQRIKLVRGSSFATAMMWNSSSVNDWTNASLKTFLNGDYYNGTGDAATYGLKESARNMIDNAKYYLGGSNSFGSTETLYTWERGTDVFNPQEYSECRYTVTESGKCATRPTEWTGIVGLMYPSDEYMVYGNGVNDNCYNGPSNCSTNYGGNPEMGWVYNSNNKEGELSPSTIWLLSPTTMESVSEFGVSYGRLVHLSNVRNSSGVRPVVYLKSSVKITGGTGEAGNPYILG